jgi:DNA-binding MarR family transcriptional regulator
VPLSNIEIDQSSLLLRLEYQVLKSIRVKSKTEKKIARQLGVNVSIISQVITGLMLKGLVERTRERRMLFYSEYFSTTIDGLLALEANSASIMYPWSRVLLLCRDIANRMLIPLEGQSLAVRLGIGAVKTTYRLAKITFK